MSKENNGWISAKTQPVPYDGYFLACTYKKDIKILFRTSEYECLVKDNSFYTVDVKDITHWQPLQNHQGKNNMGDVGEDFRAYRAWRREKKKSNAE